ncbi:MAG TPA: hypothetical protein VHJ20_09190 [Polyangia bacterium]|nr:hypothetical protein [Polyangia bacterium]
MRWALVAAVIGFVAGGCDAGGAGLVDAGPEYGADAAVPPTPNCADLCARNADCVVHLCDEDTNSTSFDGEREPLEHICNVGCTDVGVQQAATGASWRCLFESSCRAVYGRDVCHANGNYSCK